jgi:hypothetical protein
MEIEVASQAKMDLAKEQHRRRIYIVQRLPLIKQEFTELTAELAKLKSSRDKKTPALYKRQVYVVMRLEMLRQEQKALTQERLKLKSETAAAA